MAEAKYDTRAFEIRSQSPRDELEQQNEKLMELMHLYNDLKDATLLSLGALATYHGTVVSEMYRTYDLPLSE